MQKFNYQGYFEQQTNKLNRLERELREKETALINPMEYCGVICEELEKRDFYDVAEILPHLQGEQFTCYKKMDIKNGVTAIIVEIHGLEDETKMSNVEMTIEAEVDDWKNNFQK